MFLRNLWWIYTKAGMGLFIMAALSFINKYNLLQANVAKATIMLIYTISSLAIFFLEGKINMVYGLSLAVSMSLGSQASRWSAGSGQKYIKWFMICSVVVMAVVLWFK
ncbi:MAG: hypothetical protein R2777_00300 [Chitinophagales bacterium]